MGIYIPGLDTPEKCNGCCMNLIGHCLVNEGLYVGRDNLEYNSKPDWCPAMNIQPHGRLIDADAFLARNAYFADREFVNPMYDDTLKDLIDRADTIIPASGGNENE